MRVVGGRGEASRGDGADRIRSLEEQVRRLRIRTQAGLLEPPEAPTMLDPFLQPGWSNIYGYFYKHHSRVYLRGRIDFLGGQNPEQAKHIMTFPAGYRPDLPMYPLLLTDGPSSSGGSQAFPTELKTNGVWELLPRFSTPYYPTAATYNLFALDHISFRHG